MTRLRTRASAARRYVEGYVRALAAATRPLVRVRAAFWFVVASVAIHVMAIFWDTLFAPPPLTTVAAAAERPPEHVTQIRLRQVVATVKAIEEIKKQIEEQKKELEKPLPKPEEKKPDEQKKPEPKKQEEKKQEEKPEIKPRAGKDDEKAKEPEKKVVVSESPKPEPEKKDTKVQGAKTGQADVGVKEKPPEPDKAVAGLTKSTIEKPKEKVDDPSKVGDEKPKDQALLPPKKDPPKEKEKPLQSAGAPEKKADERNAALDRDLAFKTMPRRAPPKPTPAPSIAPKPTPAPSIAPKPIDPPPPPGGGGAPSPTPIPSPSRAPSPIPSPSRAPSPIPSPAPTAIAQRPVLGRGGPRPNEITPSPTPTPSAMPIVAQPPRPAPSATPRPAGDPKKPIGPGNGSVIAKKYKEGAGIGKETAAVSDARVAHNLQVLAGDEYNDWQLAGGETLGEKVPGVLIANSAENEWIDLCRFFDFLPIAFDVRDKNCFITIDLARRALQKTTDFEFLKERYAANGMRILASRLWQTPAFAGAARRVIDVYSIPSNQIEIMVLAPRRVMSYMAWKSNRVIVENGLKPEDVRAVHARFDRTSDGGFVLTITQIVKEDGTTQKVREASR